jgi:hypothetical protein
MEIYIDKPTGEVRKVWKREYYLDVCGIVAMWNLNEPTTTIHPIYERIAIEVPERATDFSYFFEKNGRDILRTITIPLSKPKVKKWIWERDYRNNSVLKVVTKEPREKPPQDNLCWRKVEGSEVEE